MKNITVQNYNYTTFFDHYFSNDEEWMNRYEAPLLDYVLEHLPSYIDTVINFGCANGRDFIPFQDTYNCIGFDLATPSIIKWACKTDNLIYYQCSVEDYLGIFDHSNADLSTTLVYSQGTLMYTSSEVQTRLVQHLLAKSCKNIVFQEYSPDQPHDQGYFHPQADILSIFETKQFRQGSNQPVAFLYLNK